MCGASVAHMAGDIEAVADVATGALAAGAIDGAHVSHDHAHGGKCLNCGSLLAGPHCHDCGQAAHIHRTAGALFHDIAHGVFHFEGRTWHTLPLLFWRPGELTRRYIHGERVRFVSPMALFLFSVFLMVAVFGLVGGPFGSNAKVGDAAAIAQARTDAADDLRDSEKKLAKLVARRDALRARGASGAAVAAVDEEIGDVRSEQAMLRLVTTGQIKPKIKDRSIRVDEKDFATGVPGLDGVLEHAAANPDLTAYKLQSSAYKFSWALIPISLPFIWLLFAFRRDVGLYDHAVFATYSLSAMTLMVVLLSVAHALGLWPALIAVALILFPPWHMFRQLKGAYCLSRFGASWRMVALIIAAYTAALIFFIFLLALGALG